MNDNLNNVTILPPFKKFCMTIGELPTSYLESMTYYESLVWLCNYLGKTVIPALNANGEAVIELQEKYIELKEFVDNYFENLDVQEEINNKLDDMAESGELVSIISAYLELSNIFSFDTINDMANGEYITEGMICYTAGKLSYNDGEYGYYKIREALESDTPDGYYIVTINNGNDLVGERLPNKYVTDLENQIEELEDTSLKNNIFLATFFDGTTEKVNISTSLDGVNFSDILPNTNLSGRDPHILYNPNTKLFYISVTWGQNTTDTDFTMYISSDLTNWTTKHISLGILNNVRWAPELFLDDNGDLYCFISAGTDLDHMVIYKAQCTDIENLVFNTAIPVTLDESNMIDANIFKSNGNYYMCVKNNTTGKELIYASSDLTNWSNVNRDILKSGEACEGGMIIKVGDKFNFYGDTWNSFGYYIMAQSSDLSSFTAFKRPNSLIGKRHGTVAYIEDKECVNLITNLDSYTNRVNVNRFPSREVNLTSDVDTLTVIPNFIYRITATNDITITNLINAFDESEFKFFFASSNSRKLTITNIINSEFQTKNVNMVIWNSRKENEKLNSISLIGNPAIARNDNIESLTYSNYITFNTGWTGTIYQMSRYGDYIHIDGDIKRTSGSETTAFTLSGYMPTFQVFTQTNKPAVSAHLYSNGNFAMQGTIPDNTDIYISFEYYCPR